MAYREKEIKKVYWSIMELAKLLSLPERLIQSCTVRYWEHQFDIIPARTAKGMRKYTHDQVITFVVIRNLLMYEGYTIRGAKRQLMIMAQKNKVNASENYAPGDIIQVEGRLCRLKKNGPS